MYKFKMPRKSFKETSIPTWCCPRCSSAPLELKEKSFNNELAWGSIQDDPDFDPEDALVIFNMMLKCANGSCKAHVSCSGTGRVSQEYYQDGSGDSGYFHYYSAKYFEPPLMLLDIPANTPKVVITALNRSFSLFFSSPPTALSCLRTAMEALLSELGVPVEKDNGGYIPLDGRIKKLPTEYQEIADPATAIKWLGNDGTHLGSEAKEDDVLDGYMIFETILHKLYPATRPDISERVSKINEAKGPAAHN